MVYVYAIGKSTPIFPRERIAPTVILLAFVATLIGFLQSRRCNKGFLVKITLKKPKAS